MMRQNQRTRRERRQQIGAEPEVEEVGEDQEDVGDLGVGVEGEVDEDSDPEGNALDSRTMACAIFVKLYLAEGWISGI